MEEMKKNTPAEFTVQSQDIADEELETVAGGVAVETKDAVIAPIVARTYF